MKLVSHDVMRGERTGALIRCVLVSVSLPEPLATLPGRQPLGHRCSANPIQAAAGSPSLARILCPSLGLAWCLRGGQALSIYYRQRFTSHDLESDYVPL